MGSVVNPGGGGSTSSWGTFTGADDVRFPVAMFIHIIEFKMRQEGVTAGTLFGGDEDYFMIKTALQCIPDETSSTHQNVAMVNCPSAIWKSTIRDEATGNIIPKTWEDFRNEIMNVFGSKQSYSLDEKLTLLRSLHKGPGEDVWAYLVRVRCAVSQILHNCVPTNLEETPDMGHSLVQVLFVFGLGEYGPSSLMSQFNTETLENLCEEFRRQEMAVAPTQSQPQSKKTALVATKAKIEKPMSKARVSARIKLETSMPDVKFKPNSDASDGEETEDEVSDDIIGQPLANFDTPLEVCNTTYEDNVKTEMVDSKAPIKGVLRPRSNSKRKAAVISDDEMEKTGGTVEYFQNGRPKKPKRVRRKHFNYIPMMVEALENSPGQRATAAKVMEYVVKICPDVTSRQGWGKTVRSYLGQDRRFTRAGQTAGTKELIYKLAVPKNWPCIFCPTDAYQNRTFSSEKMLHKHQDECHDGYKEKCDENDQCQLMFKTAEELEDHRNQAHKRKPQLEVPDNVAQYLAQDLNPPSYVVEEALDPLTNDYRCIRCATDPSSFTGDVRFDKAVDYRAHLKDQHEGNAYACHICHKGQSTKSAYGTHLWTTHAIKVAGIECWKCNHHECSFRAKTRDIVGHHITRIHLRIKPKPIECPFCQGQSDGPFTSFSSFLEHTLSCHNRVPDDIKSYNQFLLPSDFKNHQCEQCGKYFKCQGDLNIHMASSHGVGGEEHLCNLCGKVFKTPGNLTNHQKQVHDPKTMLCPVDGCPTIKKGKLFNQALLNMHLICMHKEGKSSLRKQCPRCEWHTLEGWQQLINHYRVKHLGYLRFRCMKCEKRFKKGRDVMSHILSIHFKTPQNTSKRGKKPVDDEFFKQNPGLYQDCKETDPEFPTDEFVKHNILEDSKLQQPICNQLQTVLQQ